MLTLLRNGFIQRFGGFAKSREGSLLPFLGFSKSACCAKSAKRRAQEADVIRRTVVAKGAERISPQRFAACRSGGLRKPKLSVFH